LNKKFLQNPVKLSFLTLVLRLLLRQIWTTGMLLSDGHLKQVLLSQAI